MGPDHRRLGRARRVLCRVKLAMSQQERLEHWRRQRRAVEKKLAEASPWLSPVYQTDICLIDLFIAYNEARLSHKRNRRL